MCGLGVLLGNPTDERVQLMMARLVHRGTRMNVKRTSTGAVVIHARLPIVGTGEEHDQPVTKDGTTIAFVGELLDFREHQPWLECDTELVVKTWIDQGPEGFRKFDGFWSIAALRGQTLVATTDYLSQKPLYWRDDIKALASEPDAVALLAPTTLDQIYLASVCKWGYCPDIRRTPYNEVKRLGPGETLLMDQYMVGRVHRTDILEARAGTPAELKREIENAVARRATSTDVGASALLSGGLDSAIVYTLASRHAEITPYHFDDNSLDARDEYRRAVRVAKLAGPRDLSVVGGYDINPTGIHLSALHYMQEPLDLGSLEPQIALSEAISDTGHVVCLTGDGADEFFGGYGRAMRYDSQQSDVWHELVAWHLPRLDRVMMRNCIEVRSPFLARRVAEIALALPYAERRGKNLLRELFRVDLPKEIIEAPKVPLRTERVALDREQVSLDLVNRFVKEHALRSASYVAAH